MTDQAAKSSFINNSARCTYRFANGKRCRLFIAGLDSRFCPSHAALPENQLDATAASLTANLKEFHSAVAINEFLSRLLLLLAEDRISPRKAAVLAYITNQLLRTLPAIEREINESEPNVIVDIQRPDRPPSDPRAGQHPTAGRELTYADVRT